MAPRDALHLIATVTVGIAVATGLAAVFIFLVEHI